MGHEAFHVHPTCLRLLFAGDTVTALLERHNQGRNAWSAVKITEHVPLNPRREPSSSHMQHSNHRVQGRITKVTNRGAYAESSPGVSDVFIPGSILAEGVREVRAQWSDTCHPSIGLCVAANLLKNSKFHIFPQRNCSNKTGEE